jgi:hypothetical protein
MMKTVVRCLFVLVAIALVAAPAYSDPQAKPAAPAQAGAAPAQAAPAHSMAGKKLRDVVHIYQCNIVGDKVTEAQVEADVLEMLKATKATVGGEKFTAKVMWPVAVNNMGEHDFNVLAISPSFTAWGKLWDASRDPESPLAKWEALVQRNDAYECTDSAVWESVTIEDTK